MTAPKVSLAFDRVGLVGREKEIRILLHAIQSRQTRKLTSPADYEDPTSPPTDQAPAAEQVHCNTHTDTITTSSSSSSSSHSSAASDSGSHAEQGHSPPLPQLSPPITAQNQIRSLVLISGQSGSGKSSLIHQVRERLLSQPACSDIPDQVDNNEAGVPFHGFFATGKCEFSSKKEGVPYAGIQSAMMELCEQVAKRARSEMKASTVQQANAQIPRSKHQTVTSLVSQGLTTGELALLSHVIPNIEMLTTLNASNNASRGIKLEPAVPSRTVVADDAVSLSACSAAGGGDLSMNYKSHTLRIKYVLRRFMQILCSYCPVVMVIDDLQWADRESLGLVQSWLLDSRNVSLTIIGLYRSNMLDENQTLKATLASLEESKRERSIRIIKLSVEDLSIDEVALYLQCLFRVSSQQQSDKREQSETSSSLEHLMPLAEIVHAKTGGNMFFIQQYLDSLVKDGLIAQASQPAPPATAAAALPEVSGATYDASHAAEWVWDVNEINCRSAAAGDNIMDLMKMRLQKSASKHWVLSIAACLGATFSTSHVCAVITGLFIHSSHSKFFREVFQVAKIAREEEIIAALKTFRAEALIEKVDAAHAQTSAPTDSSSRRMSNTDKTTATATGTGTSVQRSNSSQYSFSHDKVQEAALSMIPTEDQLSELKYRVGEILLYALSENELSNKIFIIANLLNTRPDLMPSHRKLDRRMKIVMLNHKAGQQAASASAFHLASSYFAMAIDLLPDDHWQTLSEESLELYSSAAESHFVISNLAAARSYCKAIINHDYGILNKVRAYHVLVDISFADTENADGEGPVEMCLDLLSQLGHNLPSSTLGRMSYILRGLMATKGTLRRLESDMAGAFSLSSDEHHQAVMKTLDKLSMFTYLSAPDIVPLVAVKALKLSLKQGITMYSASALAFQGILVAALLEDVDMAHKYGTMALKVSRASDDRSLDGRILLYQHNSIHHWKHPLEESINPLMEASRSGMSVGDVESGAWGLYCSLVVRFNTGKSLVSLDQDSLIYGNTMRDFQQTIPYQLTLMIRQMVLNLRGASNHTTKLIGDAYDETSPIYDENHPVAEMYNQVRDTFHLHLATYFGDHELGSRLAIKYCLYWLKQTPSVFPLAKFLFLSTLCCFAMAHKHKASYYTKHARTFLKILKRWAKKGNPNCVPYIALLDAEKKSLKGQDEKAMELYETAIRMAQKRKHTQNQALANERYSAFFARRGNREKAKVHLEESIALFREWGANKKVEILLQQYRRDFE